MRLSPAEERTGKPGGWADEGVVLLLVLGNGEVVVSAHLEEYLERIAGGGMLWILV
jgi:hypothetical protein